MATILKFLLSDPLQENFADNYSMGLNIKIWCSTLKLELILLANFLFVNWQVGLISQWA